MSSNKFFVHTITKLTVYEEQNKKNCTWSAPWDINEIDRKIIQLRNFTISVDDLLWGNLPLLHLHKKITLDLDDLTCGEYWVIPGCKYGISNLPSIPVHFNVGNGELCVKHGCLYIESIKLSEIIFCPRNTASVSYPIENNLEIKLVQPVSDQLLPKNCWKTIFESIIATYSINKIYADKHYAKITLDTHFVLLKEKPNTPMIDTIIALIKSNECEISGIIMQNNDINVFFK